VRDAIGAPADTALIVADAGDPASLKAMAGRTKSVISTVGPYQFYGSELLAACAASGTDYLDLCGEPVWMRQMIDAHEATAKSTGARIVFSCGFDSLPFELGVFFCQETAKKIFGATVSRVKTRIRDMSATVSGGTVASFKATFAAAAKDLSLVAQLQNPFVLTPGFEGPKQPRGNKPALDEDLGQWTAPFVMASINTRNVHRSNMLMNFSYGKDFVYDEMVLTGPGEQGEVDAKRLVAAVNAERMGGAGGLKPGEGPSKEEQENGFYDLLYRPRWQAGPRRRSRRPRSWLWIDLKNDLGMRGLLAARHAGSSGWNMDPRCCYGQQTDRAAGRSRRPDVRGREIATYDGAL
jgi:short subunit dehydrogenase-like uncharacterized protein